MKYKQLCPWFELKLLCPFSMIIPITPWSPSLLIWLWLLLIVRIGPSLQFSSLHHHVRADNSTGRFSRANSYAYEIFEQDEFDVVLTKIKNGKAAGFEIPPEVWKTRKFDELLLRYCHALYDQNTTDRRTKGFILSFPKKVTSELSRTTEE